MLDARESEIDVEALKERIRGAVEAREQSGESSFITSSRELYRLLSSDESPADLSLSELLIADIVKQQQHEPQLSLQPPFEPNPNDRYELEELLQYHDHAFIWNAYRAILKREPDEAGYRGYLSRLRSGQRNKIDILASLHYSPEGQRANVEIAGLESRARFRRLYRLPVIGYLAEIVVSVVRLPKLIQHYRQLENYLIARQDKIADHVNKQLATHRGYYREYTAEVASKLIESQEKSLAGLNQQHKQIVKIQQQQMATLFRNLQRAAMNGSATSRGHLFDKRLHELYAALEHELRGDSERVKGELKHYLSVLTDSKITGRILDLGSGRGEWLELLKHSRLQATGIEANSVFAAELRDKGFDVVETDALAYLRGLPNGSLEAVTAFHLVEHLEFTQLIQMLDEIKRTLQPGGLLIIETPNPKNLVVGACNFYADPTHRQPVFPETLKFILEQLGFDRIQIQYLHPVANSPFESNQPGSRELDTWFFGPRDFAAIAWKS